MRGCVLLHRVRNRRDCLFHRGCVGGVFDDGRGLLDDDGRVTMEAEVGESVSWLFSHEMFRVDHRRVTEW